MKQERLSLLASNSKFTLRFSHVIGNLCRAMTIQDVAKRFNLDWHTVKELEKDYMRAQLDRAEPPNPKVIGIDEISIRRGFTYRVIVSDLEARRPIWFGGVDRSKKSLDEFYKFLGEEKSKKIRIAVMDMAKAFRFSTQEHAPQAEIIFDKFHIIAKLNKALDLVMGQEYFRVNADEHRFILRKKSLLLSRADNLSTGGKNRLDTLLKANKRLHIAYLLKESFGQLWDCKSEVEARQFFNNWRKQLRWQKLSGFEKFAESVENNWRFIASYCKPENKVPLGFVEGFNNKIRVIQRRAYGLRDEEYLRLKILTCSLPEL